LDGVVALQALYSSTYALVYAGSANTPVVVNRMRLAHIWPLLLQQHAHT
jgi:hypothetical protein